MLTALIKSYYKVIILPSMYQIWCRKFDRRRNYARKTTLKMAAAAIMNLFPMAIFLHIADFPLLNATTIQNFKISWKYLYPLLNYNIFLKFKMTPVRHVGFSNTWYISIHCWFSITIPNLFQKLWSGCRFSITWSLYQIWCKNVDRRPDYGPKSKFKMAATAILYLLSVNIFNILPTLHCCSQQSYKICVNISIR